jgi:hypothetical protein
VILSSRHRDDTVPITESKDTDLWSSQTFLDDNFVSGISEFSVDHDWFQGFDGFFVGCWDENTFTGSETWCFDYAFAGWKGVGVDVGWSFAELVRGEWTELSGRDIVSSHECFR